MRKVVLNDSDKIPRLAIVLSHPVQYYSPLFKGLAKELKLRVFYCFKPTSLEQGKDGFGIAFNWDINLLEGYDYEFLENVSKFPSSSYKLGCDTPKIGFSLKQFKATHVVTFGWHLKSYLQALSYCKINSIPIAVRGDSILNSSTSLAKKVLKSIYYPYFLNKYDSFLSVGKENAKYLRAFKVPERKIIFSPHCVDQKFWSGTRTRTEKFIFIWVAKFIPLKRPFDIIDSFMKLYSERQDIELRLIGTGPLMEDSISRASSCSAVKFLGFKNQKELRDQYLESNVLVLTSDSETWGLVVNEAFSIGLRAIVSSKVGCRSDLINPNTGYVFEVGNVEELYRIMKKVSDSTFEEDSLNTLDEINSLYSIETNILSFKTFLNNN